MRQPNREREIPGIPNGVNSAMNHHHHHHQNPSLHELHNHHDQPPSNFDPTSASQDEFLEQMLSSSAFPWSDDHQPPDLTEALADHLDSKMGQQQISSGAIKALMLHQQLLLSSGISTGGGMPVADLNNVVDSSNCANLSNDDASMKAFLNNFTGSLGQTSNQSQHFHHSQGGGLNQSQTFGAPVVSQAAASGSSGGGAAAGQQKQRVRARRGQATDPHSIAERLRRERIAERMKALQELVPNANKTDKASMLDEIIDYVKFLQLQVKVLSMSRLGGAAAVNPLVAAVRSPEGKSGIGAQTTGTASSSNNNNINNEGVTLAERQVAKLMEEDMGSAMQYLQGKGLCLMPISLATAISTATSSHSRNPLTAAATSNNPALLNNNCRGPTSPTISVMTVQSATIGSNGGEVSLKVASKLE